MRLYKFYALLFFSVTAALVGSVFATDNAGDIPGPMFWGIILTGVLTYVSFPVYAVWDFIKTRKGRKTKIKSVTFENLRPSPEWVKNLIYASFILVWGIFLVCGTFILFLRFSLPYIRLPLADSLSAVTFEEILDLNSSIEEKVDKLDDQMYNVHEYLRILRIRDFYALNEGEYEASGRNQRYAATATLSDDGYFNYIFKVCKDECYPQNMKFDVRDEETVELFTVREYFPFGRVDERPLIDITFKTSGITHRDVMLPDYYDTVGYSDLGLLVGDDHTLKVVPQGQEDDAGMQNLEITVLDPNGNVRYRRIVTY